MLVDLGRNDLSRVCRPGTVHVERFLEAERYSHVTHLVSEVAGELLPGAPAFDLLRASLPGGHRRGAPKVRAMQIISELEGYARGPYAGAVGYALPDGDLDTCIAIRTVVLDGGLARLQAGRRDRRRLRPGGRARGVPEQARRARGGARPGGGRPVILLVDNYDSFTYNLAHLLQELGAEVTVLRNDEIDADGRSGSRRSHLVISPGPGRPDGRGRHARDRAPARAADADARRLPRPPGDRRGVRRRGRPGQALMHGKASPVDPRRRRASSRACPSRSRPAATTRSPRRRVPDCARGLARRTEDGEVMAVRHRELPVDGIQFHPESVLTPGRACAGDATSWRACDERPGGARAAARRTRPDPRRGARRDGRGHARRGDRRRRSAASSIALRLKGETADEIAGCAEAMREHVLAVHPQARRPRRHRRDGRRRGRDVQHLHRGRARRRRRRSGRGEARQPRRVVPSGSADVLEALGFDLELPPAADRATRSTSSGSASCSRPPTTRPCATPRPVRRELAARTVFNVLGPLTNPAGARAQVVGVYSPELVPTIADVLARLGARRAFVVHGAGGIDELSPAGPEPRLRGRRTARCTAARSTRSTSAFRAATRTTSGRLARRERGDDPRDLRRRAGRRSARRCS